MISVALCPCLPAVSLFSVAALSACSLRGTSRCISDMRGIGVKAPGGVIPFCVDECEAVYGFDILKLVTVFDRRNCSVFLMIVVLLSLVQTRMRVEKREFAWKVCQFSCPVTRRG